MTGLEIRALRDDERAWANARYAEIQFAASPPDASALVAELAGARVGLGRLVRYVDGEPIHDPQAPGAIVELGGIWTDEAVRGRGVARAIVTALNARYDASGAVAPLWCIPFAHLVPFYASCGFAAHPGPWPAAVARKVAAVEAQGLGPIAVLARPALINGIDAAP